MSDETSVTNNSNGPVTATLIRGRYYDYAGTVWNRDPGATATHPVDAATEAYLRANAFDIIHHPEIDIVKPRFSFSNDAPVAPRRRRVAASS